MSYPYLLYSNILESATLTATSEAESVSHVIDWRTYLRWEATTSADQNLVADYGSAVSVDAIGIAGHNLGTVGAEVAFQSSDTGAWAGEETTVATASPTDDEPIMASFTSASARYWRLKLTSMGAAAEIGVLCAGARMDFPEYPDAPLHYLTESTEATEGISKGGHLLGITTKYAPFTSSLTITYIAWSWVNTTFRAFWEAHGRKHKPFFFSINEDTFADARFVRLPQSYSFKQTLENTEYMDKLSLNFEGVRSGI